MVRGCCLATVTCWGPAYIPDCDAMGNVYGLGPRDSRQLLSSNGQISGASVVARNQWTWQIITFRFLVARAVYARDVLCPSLLYGRGYM